MKRYHFLILIISLGIFACGGKEEETNKDAIYTELEGDNSKKSEKQEKTDDIPGLRSLNDLEKYAYKGEYVKSLEEALADPESVTHLNLTHQNLQKLPAEFLNLTNLKELYLTDNQLTSLPDSFGIKLNKLEILDLSNNNFVKIPKQITQIPDLQLLDISSNRITTLPENISDMLSLQVLNISNNAFKNFPEAVLSLDKLSGFLADGIKDATLPDGFNSLKNLKHLSLSNCGFTELPQQIYDLNNLTQLVLSNNKIATLDANMENLDRLLYINLEKNQLTGENLMILSKLESLENINVSNNPIEDLPSKVLTSLPNLKALDLSGTTITTVNPNLDKAKRLSWLSFYNTKIAELPESISNCKKLKVLYLGKNPNLDLVKTFNQLAKLTNLVYLSLENINGNLGGVDIPQELANLQSLKKLDLKSNRLTDKDGVIEIASKLEHLEAINLSLCGIRSANGLDKLATLNQLGLDLQNFPKSEEQKLPDLLPSTNVVNGSEFFSYQLYSPN